MVALAFIDIDEKVVPDSIIAWLFLTGLAFGVFAKGESASIFDGFIGAAAGGFLIYALGFFYPGSGGGESMGGGDVKLFAALGMCLGLKAVLLLALFSFITGGATAAVLLLISRNRAGINGLIKGMKLGYRIKLDVKFRDALPFVPFITAAFILSVLFK